MLSSEELLNSAAFAKLRIDEDEMDVYMKEVSDMIKLAMRLEEIDTEGIEPSFYGNAVKDRTREDKAIKSGLKDALLANAPETADGFIKVPAMIESEGQ